MFLQQDSVRCQCTWTSDGQTCCLAQYNNRACPGTHSVNNIPQQGSCLFIPVAPELCNCAGQQIQSPSFMHEVPHTTDTAQVHSQHNSSQLLLHAVATFRKTNNSKDKRRLPCTWLLTAYMTSHSSAAVSSSPLPLNFATVLGSTSSPRASCTQCSTARRAGKLCAVVEADSHNLHAMSKTVQHGLEEESSRCELQISWLETPLQELGAVKADCHSLQAAHQQGTHWFVR
jgi:hypothetical protein